MKTQRIDSVLDNKVAMVLKGISSFIGSDCHIELKVGFLFDKSLIQIVDSIICFRAYSTFHSGSL